MEADTIIKVIRSKIKRMLREQNRKATKIYLGKFTDKVLREYVIQFCFTPDVNYNHTKRNTFEGIPIYVVNAEEYIDIC